MHNILSYCGLVDPRISASEKDLPVHSELQPENESEYQSSDDSGSQSDNESGSQADNESRWQYSDESEPRRGRSRG